MLSHTSVLLDESIDALRINSEGIYVDATMGGAGHGQAICRKLKSGLYIGFDQDHFAQEYAQERLKDEICNKKFIEDNFVHLEENLEQNNIDSVNGILFDLGVSSFQFDDDKRGFSYHHDGPLDMRMNKNNSLRAYEIVNEYSKEDLENILYKYGEERYARRIVSNILKQRQEKPIETTLELAEIVKNSYPKDKRFKGKHPARKTFQALRIAVNNELGILENSLEQAIKLLKPGGRLAVITFHSLEDRIVKHFFKKKQNPCTCPPDLPICVCGKKPEIKILTKKPITPSEEELENNNRARSAKLRVVEKL